MHVTYYIAMQTLKWHWEQKQIWQLNEVINNKLQHAWIKCIASVVALLHSTDKRKLPYPVWVQINTTQDEKKLEAVCWNKWHFLDLSKRWQERSA
jgi:hypothetical protein